MPFFGVPIRNGLPIGLGSSAGFGIAPFEPYSLFENGEQGAWYDPSDFSTLFQNSASTTPVTAVEQFVGLMLDKSKGLVLGPELITPAANRDFSSNTGYWTPQDGSITIAGGAANFLSTTNDFALYAAVGAIGAALGKVYSVTFTLASCSAGAIRFGIGANYGASVSTPGTYTQQISAGAAGFFGFYAVGTTTASVDNISVRELPGNHAFQTNSLKRPKLAARYNLLTYSEEFDNAAWVKVSCAIAANSTIAPDGATTADTLTASAGASVSPNVQQAPVTTAANTVTFSLYVKAGTHNFVQLLNSGDVGAYANFNVSTGVAGTAGTKTTASITAVGNGWYRCSVAFAATTTYGSSFRCYLAPNNTASYGQTGTFAGTETIFIWGADLRFTSQATGLIGPTYQRVAAATVYDTAGFLPYLAFDGLSWSMGTNNIVPGTDKVQAFAGVRKLSDANSAILVELSADSNSNNGTFALQYPRSSTVNAANMVSKGTVLISAAPSSNAYPAPITSVLRGIGDILGDNATIAINGTQVSTAGADQGTGNYLTYPMYIGMRGGTASPFTGWLSSLIVRFGPNLSTSQIEATEAWVAGKTGVSI
jgi:hypothetical protein